MHLPSATTGQLQKAFAKLDAADDFAGRFVALGWGSLRGSDILERFPTHPDVIAWQALVEQRDALRTEAVRRYGPDGDRHLRCMHKPTDLRYRREPVAA